MVDKDTPFIGGYSLRYDWDNMELLSEVLDLETISDFAVFFSQGNFGFKHIKMIVWAGLQREDCKVDMKDVGPLLDQYKAEYGFETLAGTVVKAVAASWGEAKDEGEAKGEAKKSPRHLKSTST
jgi:hypothetical protein